MTFRVTDPLGGTATATWSTTVLQPPILVTSQLPLIAEVGIPYAGAVAVTSGSAPKYSFFPGTMPGAPVGTCISLPGGIALTTTTPTSAQASGTPSNPSSSQIVMFVQPFYSPGNPATVAPPSGGLNAPILLGNPVSSQPLLLNVYPLLQLAPFTIQLQSGVGVQNASIVATGGVPGTVKFSVAGTLPSGLALDPQTGRFTGIPSETGTFNYIVQAVDELGARASTTGSITVSSTGSGGGLSTPMIVGIAIGVVAALALFIALAIFIHKKWNASRANVDDDGVAYMQLDEGYKW